MQYYVPPILPYKWFFSFSCPCIHIKIFNDFYTTNNDGIEMNRLRITILLSAVVCSAAQAECTGNYYHSICTFDNGDTHTITRTMSSSGEEITEIKGHNKTSGATWEERTRVRGDDTITRGTAANGARWRQTKHNKGNGEYQISGVDASGNLYKYECKESECNDSY